MPEGGLADLLHRLASPEVEHAVSFMRLKNAVVFIQLCRSIHTTVPFIRLCCATYSCMLQLQSFGECEKDFLTDFAVYRPMSLFSMRIWLRSSHTTSSCCTVYHHRLLYCIPPSPAVYTLKLLEDPVEEAHRYFAHVRSISHLQNVQLFLTLS